MFSTNFRARKYKIIHTQTIQLPTVTKQKISIQYIYKKNYNKKVKRMRINEIIRYIKIFVNNDYLSTPYLVFKFHLIKPNWSVGNSEIHLQV